MRIKISIIGSAGREKPTLWTPGLYDRCIEYLIEHLPYSPELISGGAAWADHLAVTLYRRGIARALTLHIPAPWEEGKYKDNGIKGNAGGIANYYHSKFSTCMGVDTLLSIQKAKEQGAILIPWDGFHRRNLEVAKCDIMYAFTFAQGSVPADGGTAHTWGKCKSEKKIHINLGELL